MLKEGDHPWLKHDSYILYALARTARADSLVAGVANGEFTAKEPVSEKLYGKIVQGLKQSNHTKPFAKDFLEEYEKEVKAKEKAAKKKKT